CHKAYDRRQSSALDSACDRRQSSALDIFD
ncbi:hypothetical protein Tco_0311066, partial [Tanacetum coccineum]